VTFTEDWFSSGSQRVLVEQMRSVAHLDGAVIEVGAWEGRSTVALANEAWPDMVDVVDTWRGNPGHWCYDAAAKRDIYATFQTNIETLTNGNVRPWKMSWQEFFSDWSGPIRLLFIDGDHTYDEVRQNIETALPWVVPGGVICGDDRAIPEVERAVVDTLGGYTANEALWLWRALEA
jgi:hypothetical protein